MRKGVLALDGEYQVIYRSVEVYRRLFDEAGISGVEVCGNPGYTSLIIAEEMVDFRRKIFPFLPQQSLLLGSVTWRLLRACTPLSFWALPKTLSLLNIHWPRLQNHFFRLNIQA